MIASEAGHFYWPDGKPAYEVENKTKPGTYRPTTVRDAKKFGLLPSVTTVLKVLAKPGLEIWKLQQVLLASLTLPQIDGESLEDFATRVMADSREQGKTAMELGTIIHGELEKCYQGRPVAVEHLGTCEAVFKKIQATFGSQSWEAERSFAWPANCYGGKVDLHCEDFVLDFKTKDFTGEKLPTIYDEHAMQLAAYRNGLGVPDARCAIVFVATQSDLVHIVEIKEEELERGWKMFRHALEYWKVLKRFNEEKP